MSHKRVYIAVVTLLIFVLALGSCSPRDPIPVDPEVDFAVELPRIHIVFDEQGRAQSVAGIHAQALAAFGLVLPDLGDVVPLLMDANIQHIEVMQSSRGIMLFVNGRPLPGIGWDAASLRTTQDLLAAYEPQVPMGGLVTTVVPLVQRIGLGVILIFPASPDEPEIPVREAGTGLELLEQPMEAPEIEPGAGARVRLHISYDELGEPSVVGISASEIEELTGADLQLTRLDAITLETFQAVNIQHIALTHRPGGLWLYLNNRPLPNIAWSADSLNNAADLYEAWLGPDPMLPLLRDLLPIVDLADIDIVVRLPVAEGVTEVPVLPPDER